LHKKTIAHRSFTEQEAESDNFFGSFSMTHQRNRTQISTSTKRLL